MTPPPPPPTCRACRACRGLVQERIGRLDERALDGRPAARDLWTAGRSFS